MNITNIKIYPSGILDDYDAQLYALHNIIVENGKVSDLRAAQERVLNIRNKIAEKLHEHSWCGVPEEQRH